MFMKRATIRTILMAVLVIILSGLLGCGVLEKLSLDNVKKDKTAQTTKQAKEDQGLSDLKAAPEASTDVTQAKETSGQVSNEKTEVVLYFASEEGQKLIAEKRQILKMTGVARKTIEELIKGPQSKTMKRTVPATTKLLDIDIKDGLATVSFNKDLQKLNTGSMGELITIYSIVDTLTQFPTVKKVQFLIEGQTVETLAGHVDISKPLEKDSKIIKGK